MTEAAIRHRECRLAPRLLALLLLLSYALTADARTAEYGEQTWNLAGTEIRVFTFRPADCVDHDILLVFHGLNRKAEGVRDKAAKPAREACLMVIAPLFDKDRFPNWRYHRAGVVRDGKVQPRSRWTEPIVRALLQRGAVEAGGDQPRIYLFGHSAGGQFLSRITAYSLPFEAERIVVANPSVHVVPSTDEDAPYGFGGLFTPAEAESRMRQYLAAPITIYLGQEDTRRKNLVLNREAKKQGKNRLQRGRNIFQLARQIAAERGWAFNWRLVEASDVGHSSRGMLQAPEFLVALGLNGSSRQD